MTDRDGQSLEAPVVKGVLDKKSLISPMYVDRKLQLVNRDPRLDIARLDRRVHYLHVHKCGGTTLRFILEAFAASRSLTSANEARRINGVSPDLSRAEIVMGHDWPVEGIARNDTCYFTVLREPVSRLRSLVSMVAMRQRRPEAEVVPELTWAEANWAVHLLTGATEPDNEVVDRAKAALESRIHLFGFQERFQEFLSLLCAMLVIDGIIIPSFQYSPAKKCDTGTFDAQFAEIARADGELFTFAQELYQQRFARVAPITGADRPIPHRKYLSVEVRAKSSHVEVKELTFNP